MSVENLEILEHEPIEVEDRTFIDTFKEILCVGIDRINMNKYVHS